MASVNWINVYRKGCGQLHMSPQSAQQGARRAVYHAGKLLRVEMHIGSGQIEASDPNSWWRPYMAGRWPSAPAAGGE